MKERWKYDKYKDPESMKDRMVYYKKKQQLTWRFYIRVIKKWFTPCDKCQKKFDEIWGHGVFLDSTWYNVLTYIHMLIKIRAFCVKCQKAMQKMMRDSEVILGNKDYDPPIELSRKWLDVEKENEKGVTDLVMEEITKDEYFKHMLV